MRTLKQIIGAFILFSLLSSCGVFGIHFKVHNPKKAAKYPKFDEETILLGELTPVRENFNVTFYDLDIHIDPKEKKLSGWVEIKSIAEVNIDSVQLDMDQALDIEELRWKGRKGQSLNYTRIERAIFITLPTQIKKGETFSIHIKYTGKPVKAKKPPWDGGLVWKKDKSKNPWIGVACESEGSSIWFPCKDHTSDEPDSVKMKFTISDTNLFVVSNGQFLGSEIEDHHKSFRWKISYPINLYNITFYVGDFVRIDDIYTGINSKELHLTHYVLEPNLIKATEHFKQVKEHIRVFETLYGEYPWYNDGFKLVEAPYGGMEHQSAIAYGSGYKNNLNGGTDDYLMLHEAGHEWFGNAVTAADFADIWLQEGITTYGEVLYLENRYGYDVALKHLLFYRVLIKNEKPVVGPYDRRYFDSRDSDVYVKGAWILHSLRNTIDNDSLFYSILKKFYRDNKLILTNSRAFIETVNEITGKDYNWFFDQYLYQNKVPFLEYSFSNDGNLYYRWTFVKDNFKSMPVPIVFSGSGADTVVFPSAKVQVLKVPDENTKISISNNKALFGLRKNKKLKRIFQTENGVSLN